MSIAKLADDSPIPPDDELLVAYLDGELDRDSRTKIESRLLEEPNLRIRLQSLQAGWDLLDELPDPASNRDLLETTLTLAIADVTKQSQISEGTRSKPIISRRRLGLLVACLATMAAVYSVLSLAKSNRYRRELQDLVIAEDLDAYNLGRDLNLMRELADNPAWSHMVQAMNELSGVDAGETRFSEASLDEREDLINELDPTQRAMLFSRWERFRRMDPTSRDRIRQTAELINQDSERSDLLATMRAYASWRERLDDAWVDKIEKSTGTVRGQAISRAIDDTMGSISAQSSMKLDDESIERIYFALKEILRRRIATVSPELRREIDTIRRRAQGRDPEWMVLAWIFGARDGALRQIPRPRFLNQMNEELTSREIEMIHLILPPRDLETLDSVAGNDPFFEAMTLKTWAEEAIRRKAPWPSREESTLIQRYRDLPSERREQIDLLPPDELLKSLE